eukprot:2559889-Rhodomonas_salina.1
MGANLGWFEALCVPERTRCAAGHWGHHIQTSVLGSAEKELRQAAAVVLPVRATSSTGGVPERSASCVSSGCLC